KVPRTLAVTLVILLFAGLMVMAVFVLIPVIWHQISNLLSDVPSMFNDLQHYVSSLPERYPELVQPEQITTVMTSLRAKVLGMGESALKGSVASLLSLATLAVYLILVPLLVFFLLKDKDEMLSAFSRILPRNRRLASKVGAEMNQQISNYIRGKVTEIIIVGTVSYITFALLDLRYALLLAVLVGFSVL